MTTEIPMRRVGGSLHAVDAVSDEELRNAVKDNQEVMVTVRAPRNMRQHKLAWALARKIADACDFHDHQDAMDFLKIKARHVSYLVDPKTGEIYIRPRSISFGSCQQAVFNRILNRMIWAVVTDIVPGLDESLLRDEIEDMVTRPVSHTRAAA